MKTNLVGMGCVMLALASVGCVERSKELSAEDQQRVKSYVTKGGSAPTPTHRIDAKFEDKLTLLGYDISAESVAPGSPVTVTWHWKVEKKLDDGWQLFTHVADGSGTNRLNQDAVGVVREVYPPSRWQPGEYIKDVQPITIPGDWNSDRAVFYVGAWNGPAFRLAITSGPNDGDNRARGPSIRVEGTATANAPPPSAPPSGSPVPVVEPIQGLIPAPGFEVRPELPIQPSAADPVRGAPPGALAH